MGDVLADGLRILYGGSVKPGNVADLMAQPEIDGGLVGGACLDPDDFARIVQYGRPLSDRVDCRVRIGRRGDVSVLLNAMIIGLHLIASPH